MTGRHKVLSRNLIILFCCQIVFVAGTVVLVIIGGVVGYQLAADPSYATLPVALMVVGTALATIPASMLMQRVGRRWGFIFATGLASSGALLASHAIAINNFWLFCLGTTLVGASLGFSQQFRFSAAESVSADKVSYAISFILLGSIAGAIAAPEILSYSAGVDANSPYENAFIVMIGIYMIAAVLLLGLRSTAGADADEVSAPARSLGEVVRQPMFVTAVLAGMVGQGVMTYVMTATPISMTVSDGFSMQQTAEVIRAHVIAMYLPSLITPFLISKFGLPKIMVVGVVATAATLFIGLAGHHLMHYWFALVLLGIGWNFLFVSGTTMLTQTYRTSERFRSQAANDFSVFTTSALASLLAGTVLHSLGWNLLLISAFPALGLMLMAIVWLSRSRSSRSARGDITSV